MENETNGSSEGNVSCSNGTAQMEENHHLAEASDNGVAEMSSKEVEDTADRTMPQDVPDEESNIQNSSIEMDTSFSGSLGAEDSPQKVQVSASPSDSESDTSLNSKIPAKKLKRNCGNSEGRTHHQTLRRTQAPFVQKKDCEKLKYHLGKCLECKLKAKAPKVGRKGKDSVCRFLSFRKLRYTERGTMTVAGFPNIESDTDCDYTEEDLNLWRPHSPPEGTSLELATFLLEQVGDQFCQLVKQEKTTLIQLNDQDYKKVTWRRVVKNLRELCDVCSTTLFNYHWTCGKCGFVVCVSCFNARKSSVQTVPPTSINETKDHYGWLRCNAKVEHKLEQLMLTQIVAGKALDDLWTKLHNLRRKLRIPEECGCEKPSDYVFATTINTKTANVNPVEHQKSDDAVAKKSSEDSDDSGEEDDGLLDLMDSGNGETEETSETKKTEDSVEEVTNDQGEIMDLLEPGSKDNDNCNGDNKKNSDLDASNPLPNPDVPEPPLPDPKTSECVELRNFSRKGVSSKYSIKDVPKQVLSWAITSRMYPSVPHAWLCNGFLLRLTDPLNEGNLQMFQEQWKRGQPVIVSNVGTKLDKNLWAPESFSRDFGHKQNNLINCMTGKVVPNQKMKYFWDGFEHVKRRLKDDKGEPMLLKLKDWPPGDDFATLLPDRFKDLMQALPLGEYTQREGKLNLAARLPDIFCKPDLGPKMYIAYGSGLHLDKGTTNLHLDVSDAVNVMVHVGVVKDADTTEHDEAVMKAIHDSDCDTTTINRVVRNKELPGALWHIWEAKDADKIRDLLNKIALEKGLKVERHHDAIHDQSWYLDSDLRKRLRVEYNVVGYPILQCEGDAVFIPAGAPHQVRNLNNCIKVAEDFVSPENVGHCFHLTEEFRNLTETHTNHEDKLQIKNIVYHTVKDAVAVISQQ